MNVIIIEDELLAQEKLETMLQRIDPEMTIAARMASVKETVQWLYSNPKPDLAFVDIQLADDHCFEIFRQYMVDFPVVFTTAYDKYLLQSFEYNTIDYLLKPITEEKLTRTIQKIRRMERHFIQQNIMTLIQRERKPGKLSRLVVRKGADFIALNVDDAAYFFTDHKLVFVRDFKGRQLLVDSTLTELQEMLDGEKFFRINRKYLSSHGAIEKFTPDNGKIKIFLQPAVKEDVHVSKETAPAFRMWIAGKS
ncbi:MAG TPA: LytTR family DNA-binding domain-containing protein [Cyclobacteriaceae bacterium]|nr:LytTR family DNA-binding domain-containing protein [Cyclobacteriaceae bacterium]